MYARAVRFEKELRVRFGHVDPARIAYYPRFFEWFHDGFEDLFAHATGLGYAEVLAKWGVGFPAVQVLTEYRRPARFGDRVTLTIFVSKLGERSAVFEYRLAGADGALLAVASIKTAVITMAEGRPTAWPAELRAALERYVEVDDQGPDPGRLRA